MTKVLDELKKATFYIATVDGDQPRVRPFGAITEYDGKLVTCTNNTKEVYKQLVANPKFEISSMPGGGTWLRISGEAYPIDDDAARASVLEAVPSLKRMYAVGDGIFEVIELRVTKALKYSFSAEPEDLLKQ